MPIPEFHQWLEKKTEELQRDPWVQENAYVEAQQPTPPYDAEPCYPYPGWPHTTSADFEDEAEWDSNDGCWVAPCRACGEYCEIMCEPEDFEKNEHYCGGSPSCCP